MRLYDPILIALALGGIFFIPLRFWPFVLIGGAFGAVLVYTIKRSKPVGPPPEFKP